MELLAYLHDAVNYELSISHELSTSTVQLEQFEQRDWHLPSHHALSHMWLPLLTTLAVNAVSGLPAIAAYVKTNGTPLNVRNSPNGQVVGTLPNGSSVTLTGRNVNGWLQLSNGNYVSAQWIASGSQSAATPAPTGSSAQPSTARVFGVVKTNGNPLNVRNSPNGTIATALANGTRVALTGRNVNGWLEVINGKFVSANWVAIAQSTPTPAGNTTSIGYVATNGNPLNVRRSPNGTVVGTVANGSRLELTGRNTAGWLQLKNGNYVSANWVAPSL